MMRRPAISKVTPGLQKSRTFSLPAPTGGWNAKDPLAKMPSKDAAVLENWFPAAGEVRIRPGAIDWVTGFATPPRTLLPWNGQSSSKLFAATNTAIYNVTAGGALGASVATVTSGLLSYTNFTTAAGHYLVAVNGVDKLKLYNGAAWADIDGVSVPAITGLATTSLAFVTQLKTRLWFIQKDSMSVWYLPVASIGGALTEFPLGQNFPRGGSLVAMGSWTIDGGDGADDYSVFVTSQGEIAIYRGTDPASAATWFRVGVYYIGEPLGKNCLTKYGGDLLYLCQNGLFPLSKALQSATIDRKQALTAKIDPAFSEATTLYGGNTGWSATIFPAGALLLVNIPITSSTAQQYVMNLDTGAWCKFTGLNAYAWEVFGQTLYIAAATRVGKAWTGVSDFTLAIVARAQQAYTAFGLSARQKHLKLVRPNLSFDNSVSVQLSLDTDYERASFASSITLSSASPSIWDTSLWDTAAWAASVDTYRDWVTIGASPFYAASLRMQISTTTSTIAWVASDFAYEVGGVL
jgi:hypothetical protein